MVASVKLSDSHHHHHILTNIWIFCFNEPISKSVLSQVTSMISVSSDILSNVIAIWTMSVLFPEWWAKVQAIMAILSTVHVSYACLLKCKTTWHCSLSSGPMTSQWTMLDIKTSADYLSRTGTFTNFSMLFAGKYRQCITLRTVLK